MIVQGARSLTAATVTGVLVLTLGLSLARAAAQPPLCRNVSTSEAWTSIEAPIEVHSFAVVVGTPGRMLVADERTVYDTNDGGCSWAPALTLPGVPSNQFPFANAEITSILAPSPTEVYLSLTGPHVVVSRDGGRTWATSDSGLEGVGDPSTLTAAPSNGSVVYMTVDTTASDAALNNGWTSGTGTKATVTTVYRSDDGARSWAKAGSPFVTVIGPSRTEIRDGTNPGTIWDVSVSPQDPHRLWAATTTGLYVSADGGASWAGAVTTETTPALDIRAVETVEGRAVGIVAVDPTTGIVYSSRGGSGAWTARRFPGLQTSDSAWDRADAVWLAHNGDDVLASGSKGVFRLRPPAAWDDVSPVALGSGIASLAGLTGDPNRDATFYGRARWAGTTLLRYSIDTAEGAGARGGDGRPPTGAIGALSQLSSEIGALAEMKPARLGPAHVGVRLEPGEEATRTFRLALPPRPTPIDVYFLLDSTSSMTDVIRSLARSAAAITTELRSNGIDVWSGVADFRTYPQPGEEGYNYPYRRLLPIRAPGPRLARALLEVEGTGESGANLSALVQAVTGAGQEFLPPASPTARIEPGLDAEFRDDAIKVIVHAADTPFGTPDRGSPDGQYPAGTWPGPSFEDAIAALLSARVHHVGAAIGYTPGVRPSTGFPTALFDLERVSAETESVAPPGGVDCDGDARPDIDSGEPLVCAIPSGRGESLLPAIVSLVKGIRDKGSVRLVETSATGAVAAIEPYVHERVDLRRAHDLAFRVTFQCENEDDGRSSDVELAALVSGKNVARATARITCTKDAEPSGPVEPLEVPPLAVGVPVGPPPQLPPAANAGPAQAPAPQVQPQTNPNVNPNANAQPNPVAVVQRQTQPQLALVHALKDVKQQLEMQHAMSSLQRRPHPLTTARVIVGAGALSIVLLYAYATATARTLRRNENLF